ncbi:radical SAM protein [Candidatus Fermentibacteria bacterium]|nr:radical SAM protein [Candidatus Fermentibacteria bacterium]
MPRVSVRVLEDRARAARDLLRPCRLCPRRCGADRLAGGKGWCGAKKELEVASVVIHRGEEPVLGGSAGVGNVFLAHCNLACVFCQNHQISQTAKRFRTEPAVLAQNLLDLQAAGCPTIGFVSPSHYVPQILETLVIAVRRGLDRPLIYNSNGYDSVETLELLDGIFDIYLPDFKYGGDEEARACSDAPGYVEAALAAIKEMFRQAGPLETGSAGTAVRGVLVRHLVLPNDMSRTGEALLLLTRGISPDISISLMSQYNPLHRAMEFPLLSRRLREREYEAALEALEEAGLREGFVQDPLSSPGEYLPDFDRANPFDRYQVKET